MPQVHPSAPPQETHPAWSSRSRWRHINLEACDWRFVPPMDLQFWVCCCAVGLLFCQPLIASLDYLPAAFPASSPVSSPGSNREYRRSNGSSEYAQRGVQKPEDVSRADLRVVSENGCPWDLIRWQSFRDDASPSAFETSLSAS